MAKPKYVHAPHIECHVDVEDIVAGNSNLDGIEARHARLVEEKRARRQRTEDGIRARVAAARAHGNEKLALLALGELEELDISRIPPPIGAMCNRRTTGCAEPQRITCPRCCAGWSVHVQWCNWLRARGWSFATEDALRRAS